MLLKDGMGLKVENINIMWVHKKNIQGRIVQKGGLGQFADLRQWGLAKKEGNALYTDY